jgi:hypothetical protein
MTQTFQTLTCPQGHTFPYEQLTVRDGLSVCPICDRMEWAPPKATWSRRLLSEPLILLAAAAVMFLIEAISGIGVGAAYSNMQIGGSGWLVAGSALSVIGIVLVVAGIVRLAMVVRSTNWTRPMLAAPFVLIAIGAALLTVGDGLDLGLNVAFLNASQPAAGWQLTGQVFDTLFFAGVAGAATWFASLVQRRDPAPAASTSVPAEVQPTSAPDSTTQAVAPTA